MRDKNIKVSVIIPVYNVEKYIEKCIDSVIQQTYQNIEIICVNDGSPDGSMEIVNSIAINDGRIIIINIENSGLSVARNEGMKRASGRYICFLDSDDYLDKDAIDTLVKSAESKNADIIFYNAEAIFESPDVYENQKSYEKYYIRKGRYSGVKSGDELFIEMINSWDFKPSACLQFINREFIISTQITFFSGILQEDNLFTLQLLHKAKKVFFLDAPIYKRLIRENSIMSGDKGIKNAYGFFICHTQILKFISSSGFSCKYFSALLMYLYNMRNQAVKAVEKLEFEQVRSQIQKINPQTEAEFLAYIYGNKVDSGVSQNKESKNHKRRVLRLFKKGLVRIKNKLINSINGMREGCLLYKPGYARFIKRMNSANGKICVSVIIPVYNASLYLPNLLGTLLNQKLKAIEIICINDGSKDNSLDILKDFQTKDARVKVINQKNNGAGNARNKGIEIAQGEYLLFLDADDIINQDICGSVYYQCKKESADICLFGAQRLNMQTNELEDMDWVLRKTLIPKGGLFSGRDVGTQIFQITTGCPWSKMFNREFIVQSKLQFQNLQNCNDAFFVRVAMTKANRITVLRRSLVKYRYNEGNNIQTNKDKAPLAFVEAFSKIKNKLQQDGNFEIYEQSFCNMVLVESLFNLDTVKSNEARERIIKVLREEVLYMIEFWEHPKSYFYNKIAYDRMEQIFNS